MRNALARTNVLARGGDSAPKIAFDYLPSEAFAGRYLFHPKHPELEIGDVEQQY